MCVFLWLCDIVVCFLAPAWDLRLKIDAAVLSDAVVVFFAACESFALSGERPCCFACDVQFFFVFVMLVLIVYETFSLNWVYIHCKCMLPFVLCSLCISWCCIWLSIVM